MLKNLFSQLTRKGYDYISTLDKNSRVVLMNYGYLGGKKIALEKKDEGNRNRLQLYHHVATGILLKNKTVLEVGCGRGGGASYIVQHLHPKSIVGVDFSKNAIAFCKKNYKIKGLQFLFGNAQQLPFDDAKFSAVINIESSHGYADALQFFREVYRVLQPGGYFLFADFRNQKDVSLLFRQLQSVGFTIKKKENITKHVIAALDDDHEQKVALINQTVPYILRIPFYLFAGTKGSRIYNAFINGKNQYWNIVLQK